MTSEWDFNKETFRPRVESPRDMGTIAARKPDIFARSLVYQKKIYLVCLVADVLC